MPGGADLHLWNRRGSVLRRERCSSGYLVLGAGRVLRSGSRPGSGPSDHRGRRRRAWGPMARAGCVSRRGGGDDPQPATLSLSTRIYHDSHPSQDGGARPRARPERAGSSHRAHTGHLDLGRLRPHREGLPCCTSSGPSTVTSGPYWSTCPTVRVRQRMLDRGAGGDSQL